MENDQCPDCVQRGTELHRDECRGEVPNTQHRAVQKLLALSADPAPTISALRQETRSKIRRLRPPVKAHGGKYYLARRIVPILLSVRERIT